ncbi:MAG: beta-lactamase family protein, partial [Hyphomicrobiaceae bacterium]
MGPNDKLQLEVVGTRRRDAQDPVSVEDRWHIGSCGKSITALLYARLVSSGRAEWRVPIAQLLPDIAGGIHPAWRERTIDELFVCRSGLAANLTPGQGENFRRDCAPLREQRTAATRAALTGSPGPRGRFVYSNLGYIVIGAIIDRLTESPFETALAREVWEPLGVTSAG